MNSVAIVIVTYNRSSLLKQVLSAVLSQDYQQITKIFVVDNASTDETREVVKNQTSQLIEYVYSSENLGGAGGFQLGMKKAFASNCDWVWMMDDDVLPKADCLTQLLKQSSSERLVLMPARENLAGDLTEFSALDYNLSNPFIIQPKRQQVSDVYHTRSALPTVLPIQNFSFEGILIHRSVIKLVGFPYAEYFIAADDVDYAERIRLKGIKIFLVKDAVLVRQLNFNQENALTSWKGYYMYRNIFVIHFLYGRNILVKLKPYFLVIGAWLTGRFRKNSNLSFKLLKDAKLVANQIKVQKE